MKTNLQKNSEDSLMQEFGELKSSLCAWASRVDCLLMELVKQSSCRPDSVKIPPKYRLKDDKKLIFKGLYRKKYTNPILDIEDKVGTRIVVLTSQDIEIIQQTILDFHGWDAKVTKSIKQEIEDKPRLFDYQSVHLVVCPRPTDIEFGSEFRLKLTCEIQVRTLLQHAFAEISHDSTYKGPYQHDPEIIRQLSKSMALMEATDEYFCRIFHMMSDDKRFYSQYMKQLTKLYRQFVPSFNESDSNLDITEAILGLLEQKRVEINDLEVFVYREESKIRRMLNPRNPMIFQQPIILLTQYFFSYHRSFLQKNWPLNIEVLKNVFTVNSTSFESY